MKGIKNFRKNSGNTLCSNIGLYGSVFLPNRNDTSKIGYTQPYINPYSTIPSDSFPSPSKTKSAPLKNSDVTLSPSLTEWQNNGGKTASIVQSCQQTSSLASLTEKSAIKTRLSMDKISDFWYSGSADMNLSQLTPAQILQLEKLIGTATASLGMLLQSVAMLQANTDLNLLKNILNNKDK